MARASGMIRPSLSWPLCQRSDLRGNTRGSPPIDQPSSPTGPSIRGHVIRQRPGDALSRSLQSRAPVGARTRVNEGAERRERGDGFALGGNHRKTNSGHTDGAGFVERQPARDNGNVAGGEIAREAVPASNPSGRAKR